MDTFFSSLNIVLGALCGLGGAIIQNNLLAKNTKKQLLATKLERAYVLCQLIYDGHKREISNAKKNLPNNIPEYLNKRNHPGAEMSEVKLILRGYAPNISNNLTFLDNGHEPLKLAFIELDEKINSGSIPTSVELSTLFKVYDNHLKTLSVGSNKVKADIINELNNLIK
ncbi:MAG: hypothetical protein ACAH12_00195 [Methylophilaceae bacterium]